MSLRQAQYNDIHSIVMTQEAKSHDQPCLSFHIEGVNYAGVEEHTHIIVILVSFSFGQHSGMFVQRFENYTCSNSVTISLVFWVILFLQFGCYSECFVPEERCFCSFQVWSIRQSNFSQAEPEILRKKPSSSQTVSTLKQQLKHSPGEKKSSASLFFPFPFSSFLKLFSFFNLQVVELYKDVIQFGHVKVDSIL